MAVVIVGLGGSWWNGGPGGFGLSGPSCIWPLCPPGGSGNVGGGSGGPPGAPAPPSAPNKLGKSKNDDQITAARRMMIRTIMTRKMTIQTTTITQTKIKILTIIQKTIRTTNQLTIQKMITLMMRTMKRSSPLRARSNPALRALLVRPRLCLHLHLHHLHRPHRHHVRQV